MNNILKIDIGAALAVTGKQKLSAGNFDHTTPIWYTTLLRYLIERCFLNQRSLTLYIYCPQCELTDLLCKLHNLFKFQLNEQTWYIFTVFTLYNIQYY